MPLIAQSCLDAIKRYVSIADVVSPYVQLKPAGRYLKGLSPFSHEKTPSFFIDPQRNTFKCFSSGYAGDSFRFLELKEQLSFSESVEWICERFHIPLEYESHAQTSRVQKTVSLKKQLLAVYEQAAAFFQQYFWVENETAKQVRAYWQETRHFQLETAQTFGIGFAPIDGSLYPFLLQKGFSRDCLVQSGLFYTPKSLHASLMPRFQGRLMIPIADVQGRTIAFSGRQLPFLAVSNDPTHESKYVNSPETPLFVKGHELFHLSQARQCLGKNDVFYLVEGQLDVMRCWECGLKTAVAPQGTGLTEEQLKILKRYDAPIIGLFDGDEAGCKAGIRLMTLGIPLEIPLRYFLLEPEEDPDTALLKNPQRATEIVAHALSPIDFLIQAFRRNGCDPETIQRHTLQTLFSILSNCTSAVLRFELMQQCAQAFHLPPSALEADWKRFQRNTGSHWANQPETVPSPNPAPSLEEQMLRFWLCVPQWSQVIVEKISFDWLDPSCVAGRLLMRMLDEFRENGKEALENRERWCLSPEEENCWCQCLANPPPSENERESLTLLLQQFYRRFLKKRISELDKTILNHSLEDIEVLQQRQKERLQYKQALAHVATAICLPKSL